MNISVNTKIKKPSIWARMKEGLLTIPREHKGFGKQTLMLAKDDLINTYKGAIIGPGWAVMKPLFQLFVYWFAFTVGLRGGATRQEMGVPFFIFLMVGFLPWCFMSDVISAGSKCIRSNRQFVNKISFPVSCIMTYTTLSKIYVHFFLFSLSYLYLVLAGYMPSIYNLQLLIYAPLMFLFFWGLTWSLAPMSAFSKDFESFITTIMSGLFWLSGATYNSYNLDSEAVRTILLFNPMTFFCKGYRKSLICQHWFYEGFKGGPAHPLWENGIFLLELAAVLILGIFNYARLKKRLPDVL
ncbi:MAG: ABC transporter permease [Clostridia bacterium]|nr:ABC transporter permease [Clostridia bacterium]